jgi:hypothetical protein
VVVADVEEGGFTSTVAEFVLDDIRLIACCFSIRLLMFDVLLERWYLKNELGDLAERREAREIDPLLLLLLPLFVLDEVFVLII